MGIARRSWWAKGERVAWVEAGVLRTGTVTEPRGDYSWVQIDGTEDVALIPNSSLGKLQLE